MKETLICFSLKRHRLPWCAEEKNLFRNNFTFFSSKADRHTLHTSQVTSVQYSMIRSGSQCIVFKRNSIISVEYIHIHIHIRIISHGVDTHVNQLVLRNCKICKNVLNEPIFTSTLTNIFTAVECRSSPVYQFKWRGDNFNDRHCNEHWHFWQIINCRYVRCTYVTKMSKKKKEKSKTNLLMSSCHYVQCSCRVRTTYISHWK